MKQICKLAATIFGGIVIYKLGVTRGALETMVEIDNKMPNKVSKMSVGLKNNKVNLELYNKESE